MAAVPSIGRAARVDAPVAAEAEATRTLYERYANQIFGYCVHQLGSREEAEDAVQSTFLNAFRGLRSGVVPESESAWLFKIAQNVCLSRHRSTWRRGRIESPADFELVEEMAPAPSRRADELIGLQDVLEQMPENQRRAILLREWQGLSYREIGDELELSQAAVETLIFRARRSLAQGLESSPAEQRSWKERVKAIDLGSLIGGLKSLIATGAAAKVTTAAAVVAVSSVAATSPITRHHEHPPPKPPPKAPAPTHTAAAAATPAAPRSLAPRHFAAAQPQHSTVTHKARRHHQAHRAPARARSQAAPAGAGAANPDPPVDQTPPPAPAPAPQPQASAPPPPPAPAPQPTRETPATAPAAKGEDKPKQGDQKPKEGSTRGQGQRPTGGVVIVSPSQGGSQQGTSEGGNSQQGGSQQGNDEGSNNRDGENQRGGGQERRVIPPVVPAPVQEPSSTGSAPAVTPPAVTPPSATPTGPAGGSGRVSVGG